MLIFNGINVTLGGRRVLDGISFSLAPHKITAVIGRNGSGKSTLVSCITGATSYTGEILYGEKNLALIPSRERAQLISVLPQLLPSASLTVGELVAMGRTPYLDLGKRLSRTDTEQIKNAIEIAGLGAMVERRVASLSGGERQKAYLAMMLAQNTRIAVLDEPTAYMDMSNEAELLSLLQTLKTKYKKTVMIIMHDLTKAVEIADNILILNDGKCRFFGSAEECVADKHIEKTLDVRSSVYVKDGIERPLYYK